MFEQLTHDAETANLSVQELIDAGIGRSTAYAFLRHERKNYKLKTLETIEHVLSLKSRQSAGQKT